MKHYGLPIQKKTKTKTKTKLWLIKVPQRLIQFQGVKGKREMRHLPRVAQCSPKIGIGYQYCISRKP